MIKSIHIFIVILALIQPIAALSAFKVYIDPGHGGAEPGATYESLTESQLVLSISKELYQILQNQPDFEAQLSRTNDKLLTLEERTQGAKDFGADLFVSLHANSSPNPKYKGAEFYFQNTLPPTEESLYLANLENQFYSKSPEKGTKDEDLNVESETAAIVEDLKRQASMFRSLIFSRSLKDHWNNKATIKQGPFFVIAKQPFPSVLIELGYLTNTKDRNLLKQKSHQKDLAQKISNAILDYKQKVDKKGVNTLN